MTVTDVDAYLTEHLYLKFDLNIDIGMEAWQREFTEAIANWRFTRCQRLLREVCRFSVDRKEYIERIRFCAGELATELWQWERAGDMFAWLADQASNLAPTKGECWLHLADTLRLRGRFTEALAYYRRSLELLHQGALPNRVMYNLHMTGVTYWSLERFDDALRCYQESLAGYEELGRARAGDHALNRHIANIKRDIAQVYRKQGKITEAIQLLQQSQRLLEASSDQFEQGLTLLALGRTYHAQDQRDMAEPCYRQALEIFGTVGTWLFRAEALFRLCQLSFDRGDFKRALTYAGEVQEIALQYNFYDWVGRSLQIVGDIALDQNDLDAASSAYAQACAYALEHSPTLFQRICQHVHAKIGELRAQNNADQALTLHRKVLLFLDRCGIGREILGDMLREPESLA
jgi:tetratricopeptide (TPR) repeat protein